ncbi:MAG: cation transporter, partial [Pseudomonadota bacterium]
FSGKYFGWNWMDPIMGIVGAVVISRWSFGLVKDTKSILLDHCMDRNMKSKIKDAIETDSDNRISDMHIWKVGPFHYAAIISLVTHYPKPPEYYKNLLIPFKELSHLTIEVNQCHEEPCLAPKKQ